MKNLDIEKLERQNVYKVPDDFFAKVQEKVLAKTAPKKEAKIIKLNWAYSVAAAVAIIFGITFFVTQNRDANQNPMQTNTIAKNTEPKILITENQKSQEKDATIAYRNFEKDLKEVIEKNQKKEQNNVASTSKKESNNKKSKEFTANPEVQVDQILAQFSNAELADVGKNTEQDIYLDLYN
jgi:hypothetical protein